MMIQTSEFCPECDQRIVIVLDACKNLHEKYMTWNIEGYDLPQSKASGVYLDREGVLCVWGDVNYACLMCGWNI